MSGPSETRSSDRASTRALERAEALLRFWFGSPDPAQATEPRKEWFTKDPRFDAAFRDGFLGDHQAAVSGRYDGWKQSATATTALVLLLDQFPRNVFRNRPEAFATDAAAREVSRRALERGYDESLPPVWRWFLYLPFEHSESLEDQRLSMRLFESLADHPGSATAIDYARAHLEIIERFGRFPHRNAALGRTSTPEEEAFLLQPGSSF